MTIHVTAPPSTYLFTTNLEGVYSELVFLSNFKHHPVVADKRSIRVAWKNCNADRRTSDRCMRVGELGDTVTTLDLA